MADGVHLRVAELMAAGGHLRAAELMAAASAALSAAVDAVDAVDDPSEAAGLRTATRGRLVIASATADGARRLFVREAGLPSTGPDHDSRKLLAAAGLALQAERPREALEFVTDACKMCGNLSNVERSVFIDASKGSIGRLLASVNSVGTKFRQDTTENELRMLYAYKARIQDELLQTCSSVMEVIENYLLPNSTGESTVVFYRMKGLCLGVMSKINSTSPMEKMKAFSAYVLAIAEAERSLCVSHPERLYATLDVVKFLHDHMDKPEWAWQIARKTLDDVELSLSGSRMSTLPDQSLSVLNQIGEEVIALSKEVADFQDLFGPYIPARSSHCLKKRKIEGRKCSSTGADSAILALPSSYIHPVIDYHEEGEDGNILHPEGNLQNDPEQEGNVEDGNILHPEDDFQNDPEQEGNGEDGNILHPEDNLQNDPEQEGAESEQNAYLVHGVNQTNSHPEGHEAEDEALDTGDAQSSVRFLSKVNSYLKSFF